MKVNVVRGEQVALPPHEATPTQSLAHREVQRGRGTEHVGIAVRTTRCIVAAGMARQREAPLAVHERIHPSRVHHRRGPAPIALRALRIPAPADVRAERELVVRVVAHAIVREERDIVAVIATAAITGAAPEAGREVVLAQCLAAGEAPAQVGIASAVGVVVVPVTIVERRIDRVAVLQFVVRTTADARVVEGIAPVAAAERPRSDGLVDAVAADAGFRIAEAGQSPAFVEILSRCLVVDLDLGPNVGRQVIKAQHRLELDLCLRVLPERGVGAAEREMRGDVVGSCRETAFEQRLGLFAALRAQCGTAEQVGESGIVGVRTLERRKQIVGFLVLAVAHQLLGTGNIRIGGIRRMGSQHHHRNRERTSG